MAPPEHQVWEHFLKRFTEPSSTGAVTAIKYGKDRQHKAAWCKYCFESKVTELKQRNVASNLMNPSVPIQDESDIRKEVYTIMDPMAGKVDFMLKHLFSKECKLPPISEVRRWAQEVSLDRASNPKQTRNENTAPRFSDTITGQPISLSFIDSSSLATPPAKRLKISHSLDSLESSETLNPNHMRWAPNSSQQHEFNCDMCDTFAACNIPFNVSDMAPWQYFISKYTHATPPSAYVISGPILDERVADVERHRNEKIAGKLGTGQCDGWKSRSKNSLVATLVSVKGQPYLLNTDNVTEERKNADTLLGIVIANIAYALEVCRMMVIAWCSDAGGDSASMRRKLLQRYPWLIVLDCWAHQLNLVVGDYFKLKLPWMEWVDAATEVIKWFNNHSYALGLLRSQQLLATGKSLVLFLPVLTRWTSHYLAVQRLLALRGFLEACIALHKETLISVAGKTRNAREHATKIIEYVKNPVFWESLEKVKRDLQPLAVAANLMQGSSTRLDQVLLTLANLYRIFSDPIHDAEVRVGVQASLQKRWAKNADQDVFILAVFLNPYIRNKLFRPGNPRLTSLELYGMASRVYGRVFRRPSSTEFHAAFNAYIHDEEEFSAERMRLGDFKDLYQSKGVPIDIVAIWEAIDTHSDIGRNSFVKLAILILSVVTNSASAERVFSQMGIIDTPLRNRLKYDKLSKIVKLKMDLKTRYRDDSNDRLKRKFEELTNTTPTSQASTTAPTTSSFLAPTRDNTSSTTPQSTPSASSDIPSTTTVPGTSESQPQPDPLAEEQVPVLHAEERFGRVIEPLVFDATEDDLFTDEPAIGSTTPQAGVSTAGSGITFENGLLLANLFDFSRQEDFITFSWKGGCNSLEGETLVYEILSSGGEADSE
ncbi:ribonuclease H-like domain-containing protein [Cristinia sonorae]|uniref:Ribonuclease H-like domain-containing protein n=1 Tax=Cristinia sonorae TaxID=1940300 RepID=A0A8K0UPT8_9AGAR|nr:ribonuclease H-like domain-containing protein [Cristinia sonorae]